jgi:predicted TIM-barrel fold metal-dependent hydrolase
MTIDIHTHLGSLRMNIEDVTKKNLGKQVDLLIQQMDTFGIKKAVLTPAEPKIDTDLYIEAAAIYPDRLFSGCSVMPRPIDLARKKVKEYSDLGCKSLVLDQDMYHPNDPAADALVRYAVENELAIYFHNHETTVDRVSFIDRESIVHPDGRFVVLHMGGLFGFQKLIPLMRRQNIWLDLSVTLIRLVESPLRVFLDALVQDTGVQRLVFGSEHHTEYSDLMAALNLIDLNIETSKIIKEKNAKTILKI